MTEGDIIKAEKTKLMPGGVLMEGGGQMHKMNGQTGSKRVGGLAEAKRNLKTGTGVLERMSSPATFSVPSHGKGTFGK